MPRSESSLHSSLKNIYTPPDGDQEVFIDGYLIDIVRPGLLIEIQTGNFSALKIKLSKLLNNHYVLIVHPIPQEKWIIKSSTNDDLVSKRRSPRKGRLEHLFEQLTYIHHLIDHPRLSLEVLLTCQEEIRKADGKGSWRRKGVSIVDHKLIDIYETHLFQTRSDFAQFVPRELWEGFTTQDLAQKLKIRRNLARKITYCLYHMNILERANRTQHGWIYTQSITEYNS